MRRSIGNDRLMLMFWKGRIGADRIGARIGFHAGRGFRHDIVIAVVVVRIGTGRRPRSSRSTKTASTTRAGHGFVTHPWFHFGWCLLVFIVAVGSSGSTTRTTTPAVVVAVETIEAGVLRLVVFGERVQTFIVLVSRSNGRGRHPATIVGRHGGTMMVAAQSTINKQHSTSSKVCSVASWYSTSIVSNRSIFDCH